MSSCDEHKSSCVWSCWVASSSSEPDEPSSLVCLFFLASGSLHSNSLPLLPSLFFLLSSSRWVLSSDALFLFFSGSAVSLRKDAKLYWPIEGQQLYTCICLHHLNIRYGSLLEMQHFFFGRYWHFTSWSVMVLLLKQMQLLTFGLPASSFKRIST